MAPAKGGISQDVGEVGSGGDPGVKETLVKATTRGVRAHTGGHQGVVKRGREVGGSGAVATWAGEKGGAKRAGSVNQAPRGAATSGAWPQDRRMAAKAQTCQPREKGDRTWGF